MGQTVQKLVSHWLRMGAMFWGVGGKMLFTVQVCTNWFIKIKQSIDNMWVTYLMLIDQADIK